MWVASLHSYPVKGCRRVDHDGADVEPWGLAGDRRWMIVDGDGRSVTQGSEPGLTRVRPSVVDGGLVLRATGVSDVEIAWPIAGERVEIPVQRSPLTVTLAGAAADDWLTALLDRKLRLVWLDDPGYGEPADRVGFADAFPVLLTNNASLDVLNGWMGDPLPMNRFRPNIVVSGAEPWAEDGWTGRRLRIGAMTFRVAKPCDRCVVTTTDQETGERGREPLRTLGKYRNVGQKLLFGTYLIPDGAGKIAVGDAVE